MRRRYSILFLGRLWLAAMAMMLLPCGVMAGEKVTTTTTPSYLTTTKAQRFAYYFYPAMMALDLNDYDRAAALLTVCEEMDSTSAVVNYFLGVVAANMERYSVAMRYWEKAARYDIEEYGYHYANELWKDDRKSEAFALMEKQLEQTSNKASTLLSLNYMYSQTKQYSKQAKVLRELEKLKGRSAMTTKEWARYYLTRKQTKKALAVIDSYLETDPTNYELPVYKGDVLVWLGEMKQARQVYQQEVAHHPNNVMAYLSLANLYRHLGEKDKSEEAVYAIMSQDIDFESKAGLLEEAREKKMIGDSLYVLSLERLAELHPTETDVLVKLADCYISQSRMDASVPILERIAEMQPDNVATRVQLCLTYNTIGDTVKSEVLSDTCMTRFPNMLFFYFNSALRRYTRGSMSESADILRKSERVEKAVDEYLRENMYGLLGDIYMRQDSIEQMSEAYNKVLALNPDNIGVLNNYAYSLAIHGGDLGKAERMSRRTIEQEPENPTYLDTYAWILFLKGERSMAEYFIKKARELMSSPDPELEEHYKAIVGGI